MDAKHDWRQFGVILPLNTEYNLVSIDNKHVKFPRKILILILIVLLGTDTCKAIKVK